MNLASVGNELKGFGRGLAAEAKGTAGDLRQIGKMLGERYSSDPVVALAARESQAEVLAYLKANKGDVAKTTAKLVLDPIKDDLQAGRVGSALGRLTINGASMLIPGVGLEKSIRVASAAERGLAIAQANAEEIAEGVATLTKL